MRSDKQALECDVGFDLRIHQQQELSSEAYASFWFQQGGKKYDEVNRNMKTINPDFPFNPQDFVLRMYSYDQQGSMGSQSSNFFKGVSTFDQQKDAPSSNNLNLLSDSHSQNDICGLLLGHKMAVQNDDLNLEQPERSKGFIDAWSSADVVGSMSEISHKYSDPPRSTHPISPLTLSMSSGNPEGKPDKHLEIGLMCTEQDNSGLKLHQPVMNWMGTESWMGSTPGGPLAEALCLSILSNVNSSCTRHQPPFPYGCSSYTANTNM